MAKDFDSALQARIDSVFEEGRSFWHRFDAEVRQERWHPFVAADYGCVRAALQSLHVPGRRFLEWGSATGVITIAADLMGFDACGIELDPSLASRLPEGSVVDPEPPSSEDGASTSPS